MTNHISCNLAREENFLYAYAFCRRVMSNEKKRYSVQEGGMRDVANNQDVKKYTKPIRNIAACGRCRSVEEGRQDKG